MTSNDLIQKPRPREKLCSFPYNNGWIQTVEFYLPDGTNIGRVQTRQRPGPVRGKWGLLPRQAEPMTADNHGRCVRGWRPEWLLARHTESGQPTWATAGTVPTPKA